MIWIVEQLTYNLIFDNVLITQEIRTNNRAKESIGKFLKSAIRNFKLPIKEKFCNSHDILRYTELTLYSNCWAQRRKLR